MSVKLFIGGLSYDTTNDTLQAHFEEFGKIEDAVVINDRETGRSRGFGFVTFAEESEADAAIEGTNGSELDGRTIRVDKAAQRGEGGSRGGRGGGRGGFRGGDRGGDRSYGGDRDGGYRSGGGFRGGRGGARGGFRGGRGGFRGGDRDRPEY
ncbi:hypothetical protein H9P43_005682 [Blastocladiella emersonii ATCC 22665]|nr:hypothetical protein H9P43_005682 [Blastocladiella emersonii ATCC 22665]